MSAPFSSVLVVDKDEATNFLSNRILQRLRVADIVFTYTNIQEAYQCLLACLPQASYEQPLVTFLDLKIPVAEGHDFLGSYLRLAAEERQHSYLFVLTLDALAEYFPYLNNLPLAGFLDKPLSEAVVQSVLQQVAEAKAARYR